MPPLNLLPPRHSSPPNSQLSFTPHPLYIALRCSHPLNIALRYPHHPYRFLMDLRQGCPPILVPPADTRSQRLTMYNTAEPTTHPVQQPVYHSQPLPQQPVQLTYCQPPIQSIQSQFVQPQLTCFQPPAQSMQPPPYYQTPAMYYQHPFPQPMYHGGYYATPPAAPAPTMLAASTIAPIAAQARNNPMNDLTALKDFIEQVANKVKSPPMYDVSKYVPFVIPPGFKFPKLTKFSGNSDPVNHFKKFSMETHHYRYDLGLMIHLFSISLEGDALYWFLSLTKEQVQDLNIIIELFIKRFAHLKEIKPTWAELAAERKKSGETVLRYIVRWRNMFAKSELPIPEKYAMELLVNNLEGPIQMALIYSPVSTFDELIERVTHLQQNEDKLAPITEDVLAINQNNQQGCNS